MMAFFSVGREAIQTRVSTPLTLFTTKHQKVRVQSAKHISRSPLQAAIKQAQLRKRVFEEILLIFTAQIFDNCLHERMWTTVHQDHANIGTKRINDPSRHNHFLNHVAAETIQAGHTDPTKNAVVPELNEGPDVPCLAPQTQRPSSHESSPK